MNKYFIATLSALSIFVGTQAFADNAQECKKLQDDYNVIYASKGFCFKDPEAKAKYNNDNCYTSKLNLLKKSNKNLTLSRNVRKN